MVPLLCLQSCNPCCLFVSQKLLKLLKLSPDLPLRVLGLDLKAEERQKSRVMREKIEKINKDIGTLSDTVRATEKEMGTEHALFLQVGIHGHVSLSVY